MSRGIPQLRLEIVKRYRTKYNVELDPETEAIVTIGAKDALAHLLFAIIGPGDAVVSPNPAYPIHQYGVIMAEGHACMLPMPDSGNISQRPGASLQHVVAQAEDDSDFVSAQSHHAMRGPAILPRHRGAGRAARHHDRARLRLRRHLLRRLQAPSILEVDGAKEIAVEIYSSRRASTWRVGAWDSASATRKLIGALARIKSYLDYGIFQPIQIASIIALRECGAEPRRSAPPISSAAMC